jgi:acetylornithine deacetylase/succinyl-diaminopimelate desuccinylase-like protein
MYQVFREATDRAKEPLIQFTQELIQTPSCSLGEEKVAGMLYDLYGRLGFDHVFYDDAGNVVGIIVGSNPGPVVLLNSHMDTVDHRGGTEGPGCCCKLWHGKLQGMGASDCKGGLAAQAFAAYALIQSGLPLHGYVVVSGTVAEENGCSLGARHLLENTLAKLGMKPAYAILGEPTSLGLCYGHDGWVLMDIRMKGTERAAPFACRQSWPSTTSRRQEASSGLKEGRSS